MKRTISSLGLFLICLIYTWGQAPQKFNYQAVVRDNAGNIVSEQAVGIKISILQGAVDGTVVYSETHSPTTSSLGLVTLEIGGGTTSDDFSAIDWGGNIYFLKVEMDATGGTTYTEMGTNQILSVPYAVHSKTAENVFSGDYLDLSNVPTSVSTFTNDAGYLTSFTETDPLFSNLFSIISPVDNQLLKYSSVTSKWENWISNFLTTEADGDITNEIQDLDLTGNILTITNKTSPTSIDLSSYMDDTNPWSLSGNTIFYNNGNVGVGTETPGSRLEVMGNMSGAPEDPLFEVKRKDGQTVFAVFEDSVRIFVNAEETLKGTKGGFAVGGFTPTTKGFSQEYLRITPDSVRIYIDETISGKGTKGGFAVGGFTPSKTITGNLLHLTKENYFIGHETGQATTGSYNTFLGYQAGKKNTIGGMNIFIGFQAGLNNTTGNRNIFIGTDCGINNTTGLGNLFMGWGAGGSNVGGNNNIFIGANAGADNLLGGSNLFIGAAAGYKNSTGSFNTFVGPGAGNANESGNDNTFVGRHVGSANISGYGNTFLGSRAGISLTSSHNNTFLGFQAGLTNNGTGNVFIGSNAGYNETGSNLLYIESSSSTTPLIYGDFQSNYVVINGNAADRPAGYEFIVAGMAGGYSAWYNVSDELLKENIQTIPDALTKVQKLRGVNYEWKDKETGGAGMQMGFIAQEAVVIIPEVVNIDSDKLMMQYAPITALLVEAIKEHQIMIKNQQQKIDELTDLVNKILQE